MSKEFLLKDFQIKAIEDLKSAFASSEKNVVLKSCTGSGKTIILTHFIDNILSENDKYIFVWLTPGQGNLEEQSKKKMDSYINGRNTKLLKDVMKDGFSLGDTCFINWELLVSKTNVATKEGDFTNIFQFIKEAKNNGALFVVVIDEEHLNQTIKSKEVIAYFDSIKIVRASATPKNEGQFYLVNVDEDDVIDSELIKKKIVVNLDVEDGVKVESQVDYLLNKALIKRDFLESLYLKETKNKVNPLIIVQLPNENPLMLDKVEKFFESKNISYENGLLSIWLSSKKENIDNIDSNDNKAVAIIIKQAISTGWDCPRSQILVKLRDNMDETFEIQTIGRIRRMPEAHFYGNDALNFCYLYTFDEKYVEEVKKESSKYILEATTLHINTEYETDTIELIKELKNPINIGINSKLAWKSISEHYKEKYHLTSKLKDNPSKLESAGYVFENDIIKNIAKGTVRKLDKAEFKRLKSLNLVEPLNTHDHGLQFHHVLGELANVLHIQYEEMRIIVRRLFDSKVRDDKNKLLSLEPRELYAFFINNFFTIKQDIIESMARVSSIPLALTAHAIKEEKFTFPVDFVLTYDANQKVQKVYRKNIYKGYLSSAEVRSNSEKRFEKHCENSEKVKWFYKNGDKGLEFFSIVYEDAFGKQKLFYPDYIVLDSDDNVWIIETKGGFTKSGKSEDIDKFSPIKFRVLKDYLNKHSLKGGFVRLDKSSDELCICSENYNDNIQSSDWSLLEEVL